MNWTVAFLVCMLLAPPNEEADSPTSEQIRIAARQLADDRFAVRKKAMDLLWKAGPAAETELRALVDHPDTEVRRQVRTLLNRIIYRIEPGTPPVVISMIERYKEGTAQEQSTVIREMLRFGGKSHIYLLRLLDAAEPAQRRQFLDHFGYDDWRILCPLMAEGQEAVVEQLLDKACKSKIDSVIPHAAAFAAQSGSLDARIKSSRAEVESTGDPFQARLLAALYRHRGDLEGVVWAAERGQQSSLVRHVLLERGEWSSLLREFTPTPENGPSAINAIGLAAAYLRLDGRESPYRDMLKKIDDYVAEDPKDLRVLAAAKVLLILEESQAAMALLKNHRQYQSEATLLISIGRYSEALARLGEASAKEPKNQFANRSMQIRTLLQFGKRNEATALMDVLNRDMGESTASNWLDARMELESRLGRTKAAERLLIDRIDRGDRFLAAAYTTVFPELGPQAETLVRLFKSRKQNSTTAELLARVREIETRRITQAELAEVVRTVPSASWTPLPTVPQAFDHLAFVVQFMQQPDLAEMLLADGGWANAPSLAVLRLADVLADAGRWPHAAAAYRRTWEADKTSALPFFLYGHSLCQCGKVAEGNAVIQRSHTMLLGGDTHRGYFVDSLIERGFVDDARIEMRFRPALSLPGTYNHGQALDQAAKLAAESGQFLKAADIRERNILRLIPMTSGYQSIGAYLIVTSSIHAQRARGRLELGNESDALKELARAEAISPMSLDTPILVVDALEKAGHKNAAAQTFDRVWKRLEELAAEFPDSADVHNQLAWMGARCRRKLDDSLVHSKRATELEPRSASYLDTLAEVHFQRGDTAKAIELMKRCLKMPSANIGFYRQQLKRFKDGDRASEPASEG